MENTFLESRKHLLRAAREFCDDTDKSTEFMLQYMQDVAGVDLDTVMDFLEQNETHNIQRLKK